eukprot:Hpha_TRINITY_DN16184_c0_g4::TRINITY_DN16184_c0_g4_i1::g.7893::m.7893
MEEAPLLQPADLSGARPVPGGFRVGETVRVEGLVNNTHLNGITAKILGPSSNPSIRHECVRARCGDGSDRKTEVFKTENLRSLRGDKDDEIETSSERSYPSSGCVPCWLLQRDVSHWKRHKEIVELTNTDWKESHRRFSYFMMWWFPYIISVVPIGYQIWRFLGLVWKNGAEDEEDGGDEGDGWFGAFVVKYGGVFALALVFFLILHFLRSIFKEIYFRYRLLEFGVCVLDIPWAARLKMWCPILVLFLVLFILSAFLISLYASMKDMEDGCQSGSNCFTVTEAKETLTYTLLLCPVLITMAKLLFMPYNNISFGVLVNDPKLFESLPKLLRYTFDPVQASWSGLISNAKRQFHKEDYQKLGWYQTWLQTKLAWESDDLVIMPYVCQYLLEEGFLTDTHKPPSDICETPAFLQESEGNQKQSEPEAP